MTTPDTTDTDRALWAKLVENAGGTPSPRFCH